MARLPIELHPAEQFNPQAFIGANEGEEKVCNFLLALALVYNDLKDLSWAAHHLGTAIKQRTATSVEQRGEESGMEIHLHRLTLGLLHEFLNLVEMNSDATKHALFAQLIQSLPSAVRPQWEDILRTAIREPNAGPTDFRRRLGRIRNTSSFHYKDTHRLGQAFAEIFIKGKSLGPPAISRGRTLENSRMYFIDAATQRQIASLAGGDDDSLAGFKSDVRKTLSEVNMVLRHLIERFINVVRRAPWEKYVPPSGDASQR